MRKGSLFSFKTRCSIFTSIQFSLFSLFSLSSSSATIRYTWRSLFPFVDYSFTQDLQKILIFFFFYSSLKQDIKLRRTINTCLRFVYGIRWDDHVLTMSMHAGCRLASGGSISFVVCCTVFLRLSGFSLFSLILCTVSKCRADRSDRLDLLVLL